MKAKNVICTWLKAYPTVAHDNSIPGMRAYRPKCVTHYLGCISFLLDPNQSSGYQSIKPEKLRFFYLEFYFVLLAAFLWKLLQILMKYFELLLNIEIS